MGWVLFNFLTVVCSLLPFSFLAVPGLASPDCVFGGPRGFVLLP